MTVHALIADPPRPGQTLPELAGDSGVLTAEEAATLAAAMIRDAAVGAVNSGGDLLVNHPTADQLSAGTGAGSEPAEELRKLLAGVIDLDEVRFEPQVGDSRPERIENTVRHLLVEEDADSVAVLDGRAPTLDHTALDSAAMKLRRSEVVVGPAPGGRAAYLGLTQPLEFGDGWSLSSVVERAVDAGHDVDFLPMHPRVDDEAGLATVVALVRARRVAERRVPDHTAAAIESLGLQVVGADDRARLRTPASDRT